MNHTAVIRRAWHITWHYRILWVFGLFLAATGGYAGSGGGGGGSSGYSGDSSDLPWRVLPQLSERDIATIAALVLMVILAAVVFALLAVLVSTALRYLAEAAVIRAVDDLETTGKKRSFGGVFRLGWSWRAVRLFLIDLVVSLPLGVLFLGLCLLALTPLLLWLLESEAAGIWGTVMTVGLFVAIGLLGIGVALVWSLLQPFVWRAAALDDCGVLAAIRTGYSVVRSRLRDAAIMWLLMAVVQLVIGIATLVVFGAVALLALLVGGVVGVGVYALSSLAFSASTPVILGALAGLPVAALIVVLPMLALSALIAVFRSAVWTLTYRELRPSPTS